MKAALVSTAVALFAWLPAAHAVTIGPDKADGFIGQTATVCGNVDSARFNENAEGQPTYMHLGGAFPRHKFAVRIDGAHRGSFPTEPEQLVGKLICVAGQVARGAGNRPEMTITGPSAMQVM